MWSGYTEMLYQNIAYDDTAVISMTVDAEQFPTIPSRSYLIDGIMVQLPTNYEPRSRTYSGDWDGTFYEQWTNNPAWILYALLTNERWGLGRFLDVGAVDKWSFYEAAFYCDGPVPDAVGGVEARFKFNGIINTRQDAFAVLTAVASTMLCQLYYSNGTIFLAQDRPSNPTRLFTPSDVFGGLFDYAGADVKSRWNAVPVQWVDPADTYQQAIELVQDPALVATQGYRESNTVVAYGCTTKTQAIRFGRWTIYTNQNETELVTFRVGLENADLRPGEIVNISDPSRVGARLGGRLLDDHGADTLTLDKTPEELAASPTSWEIWVVAGSAADAVKPTLYGMGVSAVLADNQIRVRGKPGPTAFPPGSNWMLTSAAAAPTQWRVASISDKGSGLYEVMATEYHPEKFAYVDYGLVLAEPPFSLVPSGPIQPASNLGYIEYIYLDGVGFPQFGVLMSWTASPDARVTRYQLEMTGPNADFRRFRNLNSMGQDVPLMRQGQWTATVTAFDNLGRASQPITLSFLPIGLTERPQTPKNIFLSPNGNLVTVSWIPTGELDVLYFWLKWSPVTDGSATWERATTSIARVGVNTTQINTPTRAGTYMVKTIDSLGQESVDAAFAILLPQITELVHVTDIEEQPLWLGDRGGVWHLNLGELWLPPPDAPEPIPPGIFPGDRGVALNQTPTRVGVYSFAAPLDLGIVCSNVSVVALVLAYGTYLGTVMAKWVPLASPIADPIASGANNTMSAWVPLAEAQPLAMGSSAEWDGHIECRVAQADGVTFADWFPLKSTQITGRLFQFRLIGTLYDLLTTMRTIRAAVILQIPLRNIGGDDVPMDGTGHLVVTYAVPFLDTPTVQITARQGTHCRRKYRHRRIRPQPFQGRTPQPGGRRNARRECRLFRARLWGTFLMSQFDFGVIDPYVVDGVQLADDLNKWRDAIHTYHRGGTRPAYVVPGMEWINDAGGAANWIQNLFMGPTIGDRPLFAFDTTTGIITLNTALRAVTQPATDNSQLLATCAMVQAAIAAGVAGAVGALFPPGTLLDLVGTLAAAPAGWVLAKQGTIGSGASGATIRANADCSNLYAHLWNGVADTYAPVTGGRGATAAADFAANKPIGGLDFRGVTRATLDALGGTSANRMPGWVAGLMGGEASHALSILEMPAHGHLTYYGANASPGTNVRGVSADGTALGWTNTDNTGGGQAHNIIQPTRAVGSTIIKL